MTSREKVYDLLFSCSSTTTPVIINKLLSLLANEKQLFDKAHLNAALLYHCRIGRLALVQALLEAGADIECHDECSNTPLMMSVVNNQLHVAEFLLHYTLNTVTDNTERSTGDISKLGNKVIDIDQINADGDTALTLALKSKNPKAVKLLIDCGSSCNIDFSKIREHMQITQDIISMDYINIQKFVQLLKHCKENELSPIQEAAKNRDIQSLQLLPKDTFTYSVRGRNSFLPTLESMFKTSTLRRRRKRQTGFKENDLEILNILMKSFTTENTTKQECDQIIELLTELGNADVIELFARKGIVVPNSALSIAACKGDARVLSCLLKFPVAINIRNKKQQPQYYRSAMQKALNAGQYECAKILLDHHAYIDVKKAVESALKSNKDSYLRFLFDNCIAETKSAISSIELPLHFVISHNREGKISIVKLLLENGASVEERDRWGSTPLIEAVQSKASTEILELLLEVGADIHARDKYGKTALHWAVCRNVTKLIECLIHHGADVNAKCNKGRGPLFYAILFYSDSIGDLLTVLLENNLDINHLDDKGNNALMYLLGKFSVYKSLKPLQEIVDCKINIRQQNKTGVIAFIIAAKYANENIMRLLINSGADINEVSNDPEALSAASVLLKKLWNDPREATTCLKILLEHGLNMNSVPLTAIHLLISSGCLSLVPQFIASGFAPYSLEMPKNINSWLQAKSLVSPFGLCLLLNHLDLATYLLNIGFLTNCDLQVWSKSKTLIEYSLKSSTDCVNLILDISVQPLTLQTLSTIAVSDALCAGQKRLGGIRDSGLPVPLQDVLLFNRDPTNIPVVTNNTNRHSLLFKIASGTVFGSLDDTYFYY